MKSVSKASNAVLALSRAFYGKRLSKEQYDALLACRNSNEIASCLKANTEYAKELSDSELSDFPPRTLEDLVQKFRFSRFGALCRYELATGDEFYKYFIIKTEVEQILRCTLLMFSKKTQSYLLQVHPFVDKHLSIDLFALGRANSFEEIAQTLDKTDYGRLYRRCLENPMKSYLTFEIAFNAYFEQEFRKLVKKCGSKGEREAVTEVAARSLDCKKLSAFWRALKYYPQNIAALVSALSAPGGITLLSESTLKKLAECRKVEDFMAVLEKTPYKSASKNDADLEKELAVFLHSFCKKEIRFSSYPPVVMLCYLLLSQDETTNLVRIIEGCKYGVPAQEVRKNLIGIDD